MKRTTLLIGLQVLVVVLSAAYLPARFVAFLRSRDEKVALG